MKEAPCLDCEFRDIGCHSNCRAYKEYKEYRAYIAEQKHKLNTFGASREAVCFGHTANILKEANHRR